MRSAFVLLAASVFAATCYAADDTPKGRINCYQCTSGTDDQHDCAESDPEKLKKYKKVNTLRHGLHKPLTHNARMQS